MSLNQNIQYSKAVISPDIDLQSQYNPNQNPSKMFVEIEKMILRVILKCKRPEVAGSSYRIILQDIKTFYKATELQQYGMFTGIDKETTGAKQGIQKNLNI